MIQEEKDLLLKDLCSRLPYGIKVEIRVPNSKEKTYENLIGDLIEISNTGSSLVNVRGVDYRSFNLDIKPLLRSMSSMTEKEKIEFANFCCIENIPLPTDSSWVEFSKVPDLMKFIFSHHLDWLGLIPKGFASEASDKTYKIK